MRKAIFVFLSVLLVASAMVIPSAVATARPTSLSQPALDSPAVTEEETALLEEILNELDYTKELAGDSGFQLFGSSDDNAVLDRLDEIRDMVKKLGELIRAGEEEKALRYKYAIAERLEALINYLPLAPTNLTTAALAVGTANPLYDELVRIRAKIEKLISMERTAELQPLPPADLDIARLPEPEKMLVYSVKFLCGPSFGKQGVQRGSYSTAINVHNPHEGTVLLYKKAVIALREDQPRGKISRFRKVELKADEAIDIDCVDIWDLLYPAREAEPEESPSTLTSAGVSQLTALTPVSSTIRFITGFVVIYSSAPLDVAAVYSASTPAGFSLDVEYVSPSTRVTVPGTPPPQPRCPSGCLCLTKAEAVELGLELCGSVATECGTNSNGETMYCWQRSQQTECPGNCFCTTEEKAKENGYVLCNGERTKCGTTPDGVDEFCYQQPSHEECPDDCFCMTQEKAAELGYVPCGGVKTKCGTAANGRDLLCFQKPPQEEVCPRECFCLTEAEAKRLGYVLCNGQRIQCGVDACGVPLFCYEKRQ